MKTKHGNLPDHKSYLRGIWREMAKRYEEQTGESITPATIRARVKAGNADAWILYEKTCEAMKKREDSVTRIIRKRINQNEVTK
jgi:hypothetical protein